MSIESNENVTNVQESVENDEKLTSSSKSHVALACFVLIFTMSVIILTFLVQNTWRIHYFVWVTLASATIASLVTNLMYSVMGFIEEQVDKIAYAIEAVGDVKEQDEV